MNTINYNYSFEKPFKFIQYSNNTWKYCYDIEELTKGDKKYYKFILVIVYGIPTYEKCVESIIRLYLTADEELDLINKHNSYNLGITGNEGEYNEYLELLDTIKRNVAKDFNRESPIVASSKPRQADIFKLMRMTINTISLTDNQSLEIKSLYPEWSDFIGKSVEIGIKIQYNGKLFRVIQTHTVQETYPPSIDTASLYTEVAEEHEGTLNDPIPYPEDGNMTLEEGKYYIEDNIVYKCIRGSDNPLYTKLNLVVGNYVEEV